MHPRPTIAEVGLKSGIRPNDPEGQAEVAGPRTSAGKGCPVYIGVGTLVVILIIVLIIYFLRRS